jgi:hypothetical protein
MYGTNFLIERSQGGTEAVREQIIDVVVSRKKLSENHYMGIRQSLPRRYDMWRGTWTGRFHPHKNNVHIPLIYSAVWADAARKASTSLNMWPIVTFVGYGPDDMPVARRREALVSAQMKDDNLFLKQVELFVSADLYGVGVTQVGWKRTREMRIQEFVDRLPLSGRTVKQIKKGPITSFDGPCTENVDLLDFFPAVNFSRITDMPWCVRRYFLDLDDIRYLASEDMGVFDAEEVRRMEREGGVGWDHFTDEATVRRFATRTGMDDATVKFMDKYARPVEIFEMWGYLPTELCPDGVRMRVITIANSRYMLRNRPNPFWHNLKPFIQYSPTPDPHYFYAPGKAEVMEKLQITGNRYINQSLDAADLMIDPMWFYDRNANINTRNLYARPGRFIPVDGNPGQVVQAMQMPHPNLMVADSRVSLMKDFGNMASGIVDDAVQGIGGDKEQTAREFIGRREAAGNRLLLESRLYEEMYLEPLANMFVALDKQFLDMPVEVLILGDNAVLDPVTQMQVGGTREHLDDFDLVPNYAARAMGATSGLTKGMRQQNLVQLLTAMGSPMGQMVMGQINQLNFWRGIFREFEIPNLNEIFVTNPMLNQMVTNVGYGQQGIQGVPSSGQIAQGAPVRPGQSPIMGQNPAGGLGMPRLNAVPLNMDMQNALTPVGQS